jgi:Flp pilus assembly protein TadG
MGTRQLQLIRKVRQVRAHPVTTFCARRAEQGQGLIERALVMPIVALLLLAAGEFGMALHQQTTLEQATQQAAQYLEHHPAVSTSSACTRYLQPPSSPMNDTAYSQCTADIITSYLNAHGFPANAVSVSVTFSSANNQQEDTITVTYPYQIILPIIDRINLCQGSNRNGVTYPTGSLCLGARISTIAAVEALSAPTVSKGSGGTYNPAVISWTPPYDPAGVTLQYNVYSHPCECVADLTATPNSVITTSSTSSTVTVVDQCTPVACDPNHYYYEVTAVQPETVSGANAAVGLESPRTGVAGP